MTSQIRIALQAWYVEAYVAKLDRKLWDRDFIRDPISRLVRPRVQPWTGGRLGAYFKSRATQAADDQVRADKAWMGCDGPP